MPPRVSSDESSPDAAKSDVKNKTKKDKQKKEDKQKKDKKAKKHKTDEDDDDDDQPDQEHDALPAGSDDDDDDHDPEFGLEGLNELLDVGGGKSDGKKISKKPATKGGAKKRPSTKKRDEAPNIVVWTEYNKSTLTYVI